MSERPSLTRKQVVDLMLRVSRVYVRECKEKGRPPYHSRLMQLLYDMLKEKNLLR